MSASGFPWPVIGRAFGRDRTTVVHACHVIEDRRDEAGSMRCSTTWSRRQWRLTPPTGSTEGLRRLGWQKTLAAGEFTRHARMVLRLLAKPERTPYRSRSRSWKMADRGRKAPAPRRQTVEEAMVRELVGRDWLIAEPSGGYRISVAGERMDGRQMRGDPERFADQHRLVRRSRASPRGGVAGPEGERGGKPARLAQSRRDKSGEPLISAAQYDAGERLRVDFTVAQLSPSVTQSWSAAVASGHPWPLGAKARQPQ
jgi:hypothetical protein